jgi:hypothetical protein
MHRVHVRPQYRIETRSLRRSRIPIRIVALLITVVLALFIAVVV